MFVKIIYKDEDEMIVNPNCYIRLIYEYIRIKANVPDGVEIDLCDSKGFLKRIYDPPYYKSGLEMLENTKTYYLVTLTERSGKFIAIPYIYSSHQLFEYLTKKIESNRGSRMQDSKLSRSRATIGSKPGSAIVVTDILKKKKKKIKLKASSSKKFPSFMDKTQNPDVVILPPLKNSSLNSIEKAVIKNNFNQYSNSKDKDKLLFARKNNWYVSPSNEQLKNRTQQKDKERRHV